MELMLINAYESNGKINEFSMLYLFVLYKIKKPIMMILRRKNEED